MFAVLSLGASLGLVSCSSNDTSSTTTTAGVKVTTTTTAGATTTTKLEATGTTEGSTPAGASTVNITVSDTAGLNGGMTMKVTPDTAKAGDVTFAVKNTGTIEHEVIVLKTDTAFDKLPVVDSGDPPVSVATGADKVDEETSVGETGDPNLAAGDSRSFTVTGLTPGKYVLVCNIAKHYGLGMRAAFTVT